MIILNHQDYWEDIHRNLSLPGLSDVSIATYGCSTSFQRINGRLRPCLCGSALRKLSSLNVRARILVGCRPQDLPQVKDFSLDYPRFFWRTTNASHTKLWIFKLPHRTIALTGGRNLSSSNFADVSVVITGHEASELLTFFNGLWSRGLSLTDGQGHGQTIGTISTSGNRTRT